MMSSLCRTLCFDLAFWPPRPSSWQAPMQGQGQAQVLVLAQVLVQALALVQVQVQAMVKFPPTRWCLSSRSCLKATTRRSGCQPGHGSRRPRTLRSQVALCLVPPSRTADW